VSESPLYNEVRLEVCKAGARVFRNNVGLFVTRHGTPIRTGLCPGSSDLIGWTKDGRFLAIEVKTPGKKATEDQEWFLAAVRTAGGVGITATSGEDALRQLLEE
jgi:hypothetical protein